jgi:hypothetical protein
VAVVVVLLEAEVEEVAEDNLQIDIKLKTI